MKAGRVGGGPAALRLTLTEIAVEPAEAGRSTARSMKLPGGTETVATSRPAASIDSKAGSSAATRITIRIGRPSGSRDEMATAGFAERQDGRRPRTPRAALLGDLLMMKRTWSVDVLRCPRCSRKMRVRATITEPPVVRQSLEPLGVRASPLPRAPARDPDCEQVALLQHLDLARFRAA